MMNGLHIDYKSSKKCNFGGPKNPTLPPPFFFPLGTITLSLQKPTVTFPPFFDVFYFLSRRPCPVKFYCHIPPTGSSC